MAREPHSRGWPKAESGTPKVARRKWHAESGTPKVARRKWRMGVTPHCRQAFRGMTQHLLRPDFNQGQVVVQIQAGP